MNTFEIVAAAFSGWIAAAFGWFKWWVEYREKRKERASKEVAEKELASIRRRAPENSPLFSTYGQRFRHVKLLNGGTENIAFIGSNGGGLLCFLRDEVHPEMPEGQRVCLLLAHHGSDAFEVSFSLDGEPISLIRAEDDSDRNLFAIQYPFIRENRGKPQEVKVSFLAANGLRDVHTYTTKHGHKLFDRIDPK